MKAWTDNTEEKADIVFSGPLYKSADFNGPTATLHFDDVGSGLTTRDGKAPSDFTLAGPDGKYLPATATITGDTVSVTSPDVSEAKAARFGWSETAMPNLMNIEGLPASPFETTVV